MGTDLTIGSPRIPSLLRAWFLATPIVVLVVVLPAPACVSQDGRNEPITRRESALGPLGPFAGATSVSGAYHHSCALLNTGEVLCWGAGNAGQLGDGNLVSSPVPVAVSGLSDAVSVTAGGAHTCAIRRTGQVVCWGAGDSGRLGDGTSSYSTVPVAVSGLSDAVSVTAGGSHTCAIRVTGQVVCWGYGFQGQLGNGTSGSSAGSAVPVAVSGVSDAVSVQAGGNHTCAVRGTGQVVCWGWNGYGQLGNGSLALSPTAVAVSGLSDAVSVAAGLLHTCAIRRGTGQVVCWGWGGSGQLGNGSFNDSRVPVAVTGISDGVSISAGNNHTCAIRGSGEVLCWGSGQLGDGSSSTSTVPVAVTGLSDAQSVAVALYHTCAVRGTGEVDCWGAGYEGGLGNGTSASAPAPVAVTGLSDAVSVAAGNYHTCAARGTGEVVCWGDGFVGQLGGPASSPVPFAVANLSDGMSVTAGWMHTCALRRTGEVTCWGMGENGQLGNGNVASSSAPVAVTDLSDAVSVVAGSSHTCAVRASGAVVCWGAGGDGQLGNGTSNSSSLPVAVTGLSDAVSVGPGQTHTCAVRRTGEVVCWGAAGEGQLGNGGLASSTVPVPVAGLSDVVSIAADFGHTCAVRRTGAVVCWGAASLGELGNGTSNSSPVPVVVTGLSDAVSVTAAGAHTCAVRATAHVVCWGAGFYGQLGDGASANHSLVPVTVSGLSGAVSVAAGGSHTCAIRSPGKVVCWGYGHLGQLGNGSPWISTVPVAVLGIANTRCNSGTQCASGSCEDGVCCASACGGSDPTDCQACSVAAGGATDGTCGPRVAGAVCRATAGACDVAETCDGVAATCPTDRLAPAGTICAAATNMCQTSGACGGGPTCPGVSVIPNCAAETVVACLQPDCSGAFVDLEGGTAAVGGITLSFVGDVTSSGSVAVVQSGNGPPPPTGFQIVGPPGQPHYWNIDTTAGYTGPIEVCIRYDQAWIQGNESLLRLVHDDGSGFQNITASLDTVGNIVCGIANSLSPFAIVEPQDSKPPVITNIPAAITAFATATTGAKVTYTLPKAVDAVDGARPVTCSRASGTTFPPGKTTVTCTAADKTGNKGTVTFTVWVQYQAPADGTFFLKPIRPNGASIFRIGRPVPVRFKLTGASANITNLVAKLVVTKISNSVQGTTEDVSDETDADTGFVFQYRAALKWYAYRWKTTDQTQGTYQLKADLGDGVVHQINVSLRAAR